LLVLDYGTLLTRSLNRWADTLVMTFAHRSDGEGTEIKFCE